MTKHVLFALLGFWWLVFAFVTVVLESIRLLCHLNCTYFSLVLEVFHFLFPIVVIKLKPFIFFHIAIFNSSFACQIEIANIIIVIVCGWFGEMHKDDDSIRTNSCILLFIYLWCTVRQWKRIASSVLWAFTRMAFCIESTHLFKYENFSIREFSVGFLAQSILHPLPKPFM